MIRYATLKPVEYARPCTVRVLGHIGTNDQYTRVVFMCQEWCECGDGVQCTFIDDGVTVCASVYNGVSRNNPVEYVATSQLEFL